MDDAYYILFRDGAPKDWAKAADALVEGTRALGKGEAAKACRTGHGLMMLPLPKESAAAGVAALKSIGLECCILVKDALMNVPTAQIATAAYVESDGVRYQRDQTGESLLLPQSAIGIIYAGYVKPRKNTEQAIAEVEFQDKENREAKSLTGMRTGVAVASILTLGPIGLIGARNLGKSMMSTPAAPSVTARTAESFIDLVSVNPSMRIRLRQRRFNYQCLGERMLPTLRGNFRLLLNDLLDAVPDAIQIGHVKEAANGMDLEQDKFIREEADVDLEMTAILTRSAVAWSS